LKIIGLESLQLGQDWAVNYVKKEDNTEVLKRH